MRKRVLMILSACVYYSGLVKLARWWIQCSRPCLVILNYHRAAGGDLRHHLLYLRHHYRILHLEQALEELYTPCKEGLRRRNRRTPLVLTFDDGYYDNYTHAFALACELQVPITIFLIPGHIENGHAFWWQEGDSLVQHAGVEEATVEGHTYHLDQLEERKALARAIDARVRYATSVAEREAFLTATRKALAVTSSVTAQEKLALPLAWAQVREMEESGWVSFGAHTMHHPVLAYLTDPAEVQFEVGQCRVMLERQLGHPIRTFAYPLGQLEHIGEHGRRAVQQAGYAWAVTTIRGFNTPRSNPYLLRRIGVGVAQHWLVVAAEAAGVLGLFLCLSRIPRTFIRNHLTRILQR